MNRSVQWPDKFAFRWYKHHHLALKYQRGRLAGETETERKKERKKKNVLDFDRN